MVTDEGGRLAAATAAARLGLGRKMRPPPAASCVSQGLYYSGIQCDCLRCEEEFQQQQQLNAKAAAALKVPV